MSTPAVPPRDVVQIRLVDERGKPLRRITCRVVDSVRVHSAPDLGTDDDGIVNVRLPRQKVVGQLVLEAKMFTKMPVRIPLEVRPLEGADTLAGVRARLQNLGYLAMKSDAKLDAPADDQLALALDRFRFVNKIVDKDLVPIGPAAPPLDDRTRQRLEAAHDTPQGKLLDSE